MFLTLGLLSNVESECSQPSNRYTVLTFRHGVEHVLFYVESDTGSLLWGHNHVSALLFDVCLCLMLAAIIQEKWCLCSTFSGLNEHCYYSVFVCVQSGMRVSALVCFEWSVMRVWWQVGQSRFKPLGVSVLRHLVQCLSSQEPCLLWENWW